MNVWRRSWNRQATLALFRAVSQATFQRCIGCVGTTSYVHSFRSIPGQAILLKRENVLLGLPTREKASPMSQHGHGARI